MPALARFLADTLNPLFVLLLLIAPFVGPRREAFWRFWAASALALGVAVALAETGKALPVWPAHPGFPSGHETFGLTLATCLVCHDRRWLWAAALLAALLAWALVSAGYHRPVEVAGSLLIGPPVAFVCQMLFAKSPTPSR